jgi:electron transfer flavoprotein beta subunit
MKVLVAVKGVPDFSVPVRVLADGSDVDMDAVRKVINPFDEIAVEEAMRLKEKGLIQEVIIVSIGPQTAQAVLRVALAMGADRGVLIESDKPVEPALAAVVLAALATEEHVNLCLLGKQAVDTDNNQVGQMLAGRLGWAQGTFASSVNLNADGVLVTREVDSGLETVQLTLPAVITTDLRLNQPRYLSLPGIVKAKSKPIKVTALKDMKTTEVSSVKTLKVTLPVRKRANIRVSSVAELMERLYESKVL